VAGVHHDKLGEGVLIAGARTPNQLLLGGRPGFQPAVLGRNALVAAVALGLPDAIMGR
jgi:hypothetical protein